MYRKDSTGWIKHVDFIILDLICLQVAFVLAYALSGYGANPYQLILYRNMAVFMEVADLVVLFAMGTLKNVLKRGYYKDFVVTAQHGVILGACLLLYLFMLQEGQQYSRLALVLNIVIYILLTYLVRELWKHLLRKKMEDGENRSLLLVVSADVVSSVVESMKEHNYARYKIAGIAVIDKEMTGKYIDGVKVVANMENAAEYVCKEWIDEVLIVTSGVVPYPKELIEQFTETGVTVHLNLAKVQSVPGKKQFVEKVGDYTVLTTSINYASTRDLMLKRLMDIAGGLVGCLITGILFIFVAPAIYIASPGPIFFAQERVGKNGKRFKMYKFRSMYMDAEERKAELMKDNKLGDEKMFKLDFDPRVIGNKILPDGTHKTGIGDFIRRTSIDEFPQFFNVLKGDMSIIGTRPPLISETNFYELHHRARLAIKPGITGMWQVSGRSDITDFTEGDRQRTKNQQQVLMGIIDKITSPAIVTNYASIMDSMANTFSTTMSNDEITDLIKYQLNKNPKWKMEQYMVDGTGDTLMCAELGDAASVMVPDQSTVKMAKDKINAVLAGNSSDDVQ